MSSQYRIICLSHDPGIEVDGPEEWYQAEPAIAACAARSGPAADHPRCDLVIGRYSYPLVEVCCPGMSTDMPYPHPTGRYHRGPMWIDSMWLRLLIVAPAEVREAAQLGSTCWTHERVQRLRPLLLPIEAGEGRG